MVPSEGVGGGALNNGPVASGSFYPPAFHHQPLTTSFVVADLRCPPSLSPFHPHFCEVCITF